MTFAKLAAIFPAAMLGFGECGTEDPASKALYVSRYYRRKLDEPRWVGGNFWWYSREDLVPVSSRSGRRSMTP